MKNRKNVVIAIVVVLCAGFLIGKGLSTKGAKETFREDIKPSRGDMEVLITTTGSVQPQNRLEIKPPINGRVEEILVREGDKVQKGQVEQTLQNKE